MTEYPETLVARTLGVRKRRLAELRASALVKGHDWVFTDPRLGVVYTEAGLEKLLVALGIDAKAVRWPAPGEGVSVSTQPETEASAPKSGASAAEFVARLEDPADPPAPALAKISAAAPASPAPPPAAPGEIPAAMVVGAAVAVVARQEAAQPRVELVVSRLTLNPYILLATPRAGGAEVRVRVKSNANFTRGMALTVRAPADSGEVHYHEGPCPRRKGHW